ncbi:Smr/MutS family protein [uncultured Desulfobacter sp.]|uniref:Smr/MutS family protein n=1 Tax=uncultured Desulfobacter sp. TaxID=240139 RepID=UPI0029F5521A|nr:Smr/MutS family protein [uncultured Desulfobacter sp.]
MAKKNTRKNKQKIKRKNNPPKLASDTDFIDAFLMDGEKSLKENQLKIKRSVQSKKNLNKHGLPFLDDYEIWMNKNIDSEALFDNETLEQDAVTTESEEDFSTLLEASLKGNRSFRKIPKPMPLKRRLERYPPPEADLDLHGFTAIGAQVKARSFISKAHEQCFFTLRIIVGKGLHSEDRPVLPHVVEDLIKEMKKENIVLSYKWEGVKKSKLGAVLVYLNRFDD